MVLSISLANLTVVIVHAPRPFGRRSQATHFSTRNCESSGQVETFAQTGRSPLKLGAFRYDFRVKPTLTSPTLKVLQKRLSAWYGANHRDLPWRGHPDPYAVLVSEFMLQQTQVATATPYFQDFLKRFPTMERLANASEDSVLAAWSGLGYYRRARALKQTAVLLLRDHRGLIPKNTEELKKLPGIGNYTAAALTSIVHGAPEAVMDGNVMRVLSRLAGWDKALETKESQGFLQDLAEALLDPRDSGTWNQAMMELGALICLPKKPNCRECPWKGHCAARGHNPERLPVRGKKINTVPVEYLVGVIRGSKGALLVKREDPRLLKDSWEFPGIPRRGRGVRSALTAYLADRLSHKVSVEAELGSVKHSITHRRITARAFEVRAPGIRARPGKRIWVGESGLAKLHISSMTAKLFKTLW